MEGRIEGMATLFEKTRLNGMELSNRSVRSATWEGLADPGGFPTDRLTQVYVDLAKGGVGMIITGHAYVAEEGQAGPLQLGLSRDDHVPSYERMTEAVHAAGGTIVAQLAHAGCRAPSRLTGKPPMGPSGSGDEGDTRCREMTASDILKVKAAFAGAAARARKAGFDGVQMHAAHGYLLSQFLSPLWNRRQDTYGGPIENRALMLLETFRSIRDAVGRDFAVMAKVNCEDFADGGLTLDDMLAASRMLEQAGMDAIEMSGGAFSSAPYIPSRTGRAARTPEGAYYAAAARRFKERLRIPLILVGGIRSRAAAERLIREGVTDYVAFSRPLIAEPDLIGRWRSGTAERAVCKSDNLCFKPAFEGRGVCCVTRQRQRGRKSQGVPKQ
jgi:2,4-dienoyl-CoA reductase-like NADH-dependent reductase (Old Yellow Enzyme family)